MIEFLLEFYSFEKGILLGIRGKSKTKLIVSNDNIYAYIIYGHPSHTENPNIVGLYAATSGFYWKTIQLLIIIGNISHQQIP